MLFPFHATVVGAVGLNLKTAAFFVRTSIVWFYARMDNLLFVFAHGAGLASGGGASALHLESGVEVELSVFGHTAEITLGNQTELGSVPSGEGGKSKVFVPIQVIGIDFRRGLDLAIGVVEVDEDIVGFA